MHFAATRGAAPLPRRGRLLASLDHPHIVPHLRLRRARRRVPAGDGAAHRRHRRSSACATRIRRRATACSWTVALCAGLHYAHEREVLHRDVKPENVMFSADGVLRVTDFGIAKLMSATSPTKTGAVMGTPAYIAPEQAQGRPADAGDDVYAAGTVLYEMLAGRLPYDAADSPLVALFQHVHEDHRPLLEAAPEVPPPVAEVVERSLARDPEDRFDASAARWDTSSLARPRSRGARSGRGADRACCAARSPAGRRRRPPAGDRCPGPPGRRSQPASGRAAPVTPGPGEVEAAAAPGVASGGTRRRRHRPGGACRRARSSCSAAATSPGRAQLAAAGARRRGRRTLVIGADHGDAGGGRGQQALVETSGATAQALSAGSTGGATTPTGSGPNIALGRRRRA